MEGICKETIKVDSILSSLDSKINWLEMVSPTKNHQRWVDFKKNNFKNAMPLTYKDINVDLDGISKELDSLDFSKIKNSIIASLLHEKKEELDLFVDLIKYRGTDGFLTTSIHLFGGTQPTLLNLAHDILKKVPLENKKEDMSSVLEFVDFAQNVRESYKKENCSFDFKINLEKDLNSSLMVNEGHLYISKDMHVPRNRIPSLVAHEVEVHVLTSFNGSMQPLRLLKTGLANYDTLQEGLATFSEYLSGNLSGERLRVLAARVIASEQAIKGESIESIFAHLIEEHNIEKVESFDIAVRAKRGGGLTKDAVYLEGLRQVHAYSKTEDDLSSLFLGKFSLNQRDMLDKLVADNILISPMITPHFLKRKQGIKLLQESRQRELPELFHRGY
jgi:uncharacterized protein (TIGR02421 family)